MGIWLYDDDRGCCEWRTWIMNLPSMTFGSNDVARSGCTLSAVMMVSEFTSAGEHIGERPSGPPVPTKLASIRKPVTLHVAQNVESLPT